MKKKSILIITTNPTYILWFFKRNIEKIIPYLNVSIASSFFFYNNDEKKKFKNFIHENKITWYRINIKRDISIFSDFHVLFQLFKVIKKNKYSISLTFMPKAGLLGQIILFFKKVPIRIHYFMGQLWENEKNFLKKYLLLYLDILIYKLSTNPLDVSKTHKNLLVKNKIGLDKNIRVIGNGSVSGINEKYFFLNENKLKSNEINKLKILFIGRLNEDKGLIDIFNIAENLILKKTKFTFDIVGPDEDNIVEYFDKNHKNLKPYFNFYGFQNDVTEFYKKNNLFLFPSYRESFGQVVAEAAASGIPIISYNITGIKEIVNNKIGFLFEPGDLNNISNFLDEIYLGKVNLKYIYSNNSQSIYNRFLEDNVSENFKDFILGFK